MYRSDQMSSRTHSFLLFLSSYISAASLSAPSTDDHLLSIRTLISFRSLRSSAAAPHSQTPTDHQDQWRDFSWSTQRLVDWSIIIQTEWKSEKKWNKSREKRRDGFCFFLSFTSLICLSLCLSPPLSLCLSLPLFLSLSLAPPSLTSPPGAISLELFWPGRHRWQIFLRPAGAESTHPSSHRGALHLSGRI